MESVVLPGGDLLLTNKRKEQTESRYRTELVRSMISHVVVLDRCDLFIH